MATPEMNPDQEAAELAQQQQQAAQGEQHNQPQSLALPDGFTSYEELVAAAQRGKVQQGAAGDGRHEGLGAGGEGGADKAEDTADEIPQGLSDAEYELRTLKTYESVGGQEEYGKIVEYARANLSPEQIEVYDAAVNGTNPQIAAFATQALKSMYDMHNVSNHGQRGNMTHPSAGTQGVTGYATMSEMMNDMADPRYLNDESFNNLVAQKVALSNF